MNKPIEDWMLTAYVFGDLDEDQLQVVESAIARNPALQSEIDEIRSTVTTVGKALREQEPYLLSEDQRVAMRTSIASAMEQEHPVIVPVSQVSSDHRSNARVWWFGLSALAASGLIAIAFGPRLISPHNDISFTTEALHRSAGDESERGAEASNLGREEKQLNTGISDDSRRFDSQNLDFVESNAQLKESEDLKSNEFFARDADIKSQISNGQIAGDSLEKKSALGLESSTASAMNSKDAPEQPGVRGLQLGESSKVETFSLNDSEGVEAKPNVHFDSFGNSVNRPLETGPAPATKPASDPLADGTASPTQYAAPQAAGVNAGYGAGASYGGGPAAPSGGSGGYGGGYGGGPAGPGGYGANYGGRPGVVPGQQPQSQQQSGQLYGEVNQSDFGSLAKSEKASSFRYQATPESLKQEQEVASTEFGRGEAKGDQAALYAQSSVSGRLATPHAWMSVRPEAALGDRFEAIQENEFQLVEQKPVTTFSVDVDTASYSKIRQVLTESNALPNPNAVRIEEMINYFSYNYEAPADNQPFAAHFAAAECPWNSNYKLMRIALQAKKIENKERPRSNIVFLLDVSGSMDEPNKLPLVKKSIQMLVRQLGENDRVAIVVYAGAAGCVLPSTSAVHQEKIMDSLERLSAGGSTNGGQGIELAYQIARENFIKGGVNRIILCTDGDFNVGTTNDDALVELVVQNAKAQNVFLTCLGFGQGNMNDAMMEKITNRGNGFYKMVDTESEARKIMVEQINATLITVAKDVKIQVEFNPQKITAYRQIGYEDRKLENRDFNDDSKDAGEIGAGHRVTVLYEIVPTGASLPQTPAQEEPLRYSVVKTDSLEEQAQEKRFGSITKLDSAVASELLTVKLRYKKPEEDVSTKIEFPLTEEAYSKPVDQDFRWASSIAQFGMLLRHSKYATNLKWNAVQEQAATSAGSDEARLEAVDLIRKAKILSGGNDQK